MLEAGGRSCGYSRAWGGAGDEEVAGCCCSAAAGGSFVASMLMREIVACGRWKREDLSAAGWKAVFSVAERSAAGRGKVWCVGGVRVCCWKRKMELLSWRRGEAVAEGEAAVLVVVCGSGGTTERGKWRLVRGSCEGGLLWVLRFVAMGGGLRCWLEKEKKMGERRGGRFQREGEAVKRGRKWWYQPGQKNEGHRGAVCREETILWWAAAAGCERDRFRVSLPLFYLSKLPPLEKISVAWYL